MAVPTVWSGAPESWSPVPAPGALRERDGSGPGAPRSRRVPGRERRSRTGARRERPGAAWSAPGAPWSAPGACSRRSRLPEAGAHSISSRRACPWMEHEGGSGSLGRVPRARPDAPKTGFVFQGQAQRDASKCAPGRSRSGSAAPYRRERPGAARERDWSDRERTRERSLEPGSSAERRRSRRPQSARIAHSAALARKCRRSAPRPPAPRRRRRRRPTRTR